MVEASSDYGTNMDAKEVESLKKERFDIVKLEALTDEVLKDLTDLHPDQFLKSILEIVKIFNEMSSALSIAFQDITSKVAIIRKNYNELPEVKGGIFTFVRREIELGIHPLNSHNNKKLTTDPRFKNYESTARTLVRLSWFFALVTHLFKALGENPKKSPGDAAKEAYNLALGPHHPFMLRQIAKLAFVAAPNRKTFEKRIFGEGASPEESCKILLNNSNKMQKVRDALVEFLTTNKLTELP